MWCCVSGGSETKKLSFNWIYRVNLPPPKNWKAARFKREPFEGPVVVATCSEEGFSSIRNVSFLDFLHWQIDLYPQLIKPSFCDSQTVRGTNERPWIIWEWGYILSKKSYWGARDGAVVRALASHQCGPGSNPGVDAICGLSLLLVLSFATRRFSPGTPVLPLLKNQHFQRRTSLWMCYLQVVICYLLLSIYLYYVALIF